MKQSYEGNCRTTAMGILPHVDLDAALRLAFSLDIPFWPQLPHYSFYEDMYVQVSEHFPGIKINERELKIFLDRAAFYRELEEYAAGSGEEDFFRLSPAYAAALSAFLARDLSRYYAVRGQSIGPLSFGLKVTTGDDLKPIIYNDDIREFLFDFLARKINAQYRQLKEKNERAFVWVDEPGLEILFSSFTGYPSHRAKKDFGRFLETLETPRGVHLCGNPDWSFLLDLELDILSLDIYANGGVFVRYTTEVKNFLLRGGIICWGIVPTLTEELTAEEVASLAAKLEGFWDYLVARGVDKELILRRAWLAPARCCLVNADGHLTVERAFEVLRCVAACLKEKYRLPG